MRKRDGLCVLPRGAGWRRVFRKPLALLGALAVVGAGVGLSPVFSPPEAGATINVNPPGPQMWYQGTARPHGGARPGNYNNRNHEYAYCASQDHLLGPAPSGASYSGAYDITFSGLSGTWNDAGQRPHGFSVAGGIQPKQMAYVISRYGRTADTGEAAATKIALYMMEGVWSGNHFWYGRTSDAVKARARQMAEEAVKWAGADLDMPVPTISGAKNVGELGKVGNIGIQPQGHTNAWWPAQDVEIIIKITSGNAVFYDGSTQVKTTAQDHEQKIDLRRTKDGDITIEVSTAKDNVPLPRLYKMNANGHIQDLYWAPHISLNNKTGKPNKPDVSPEEQTVGFRTTASAQVVTTGTGLSDSVEAFLPNGGAWPYYETVEADPAHPGQTVTVRHPFPVRVQVSLFGPFTTQLTPGGPERPAQYLRKQFDLVFTGPGRKPTGVYTPKTAGFYTWTVDATLKMQDPVKLAASNLKNLDVHSPLGETVETTVVKMHPVAKSSVQHSLGSLRDPDITGIDWPVTHGVVTQPSYSCPEPTPGADEGRTCPPYPYFKFYKNEKEDHENQGIDRIHAYVDNGAWLKDATGAYQPVKYTGRLYYSNTMIHDMGEAFNSLDLVATRTIIANGPGDYTIPFAEKIPMERLGFYTWVWSVEDAQPGPHPEWIETGWKSTPFEYSESEYIRFPPNVDSKVYERNVNRGGRSIDYVTISHIVPDHGAFKGVGNVPGKADTFWMADNMKLHMTLYGPYEELPGASFRYKLTTNPADNTQPRVCTITVPMKNGRVGERTLPSGEKVWGVGWSNERPGQEGQKGFLDKECITEKPGYYRWVASFEGDDRVAPYISPTDDIYEWITVDRVEPSIWTQADHRVENGQPMRDTVHVVGQPKDSWKKDSRFVFDVYGPFTAGEVPVATPEHLFKRVPAREPFKGIGAYPSRDIVPTDNGYYYWQARLIQGEKQCFQNLDGEASSPGSVAPETKPEQKFTIRVSHPQAGQPAKGTPLTLMASISGVYPKGSKIVSKVIAPDGTETVLEDVTNFPKGAFEIDEFTPTQAGDWKAEATVLDATSKPVITSTFTFTVIEGAVPAPVGTTLLTGGLGLPKDFNPNVGDMVRPYANLEGDGKPDDLFVRFKAFSDQGGALESDLVKVLDIPSTITGPDWLIDKPGEWTVSMELVKQTKDADGKLKTEVVDVAEDWWGLHFTVSEITKPATTTPKPGGVYPPAGCEVLWESEVGESGENTWVYAPGTPLTPDTPVIPPRPDTPPTPPGPPPTPPTPPDTPGLEVRTEAGIHNSDPATLGKLSDKLIVTGTVPEGAYAVVQLFYQATDTEPKTCAAPIWTSEKVMLTGAGEYRTNEYSLDKAGTYHFREIVYSKDGKIIKEGKCGVKEETITVRPNTPGLKVTTIAKQAPADGKDGVIANIYDTLEVTGTVPEGAYAIVELFYQTDTNNGLQCGTPLWTSQRVALNGPGQYQTDKYSVIRKGVYHFRETVFDKDGKILTQGDCGVTEETVNITDDRGDGSGDGSSTGLANTGVNAYQSIALAMMLITVGGLLVLVQARKREEAKLS